MCFWTVYHYWIYWTTG